MAPLIRPSVPSVPSFPGSDELSTLLMLVFIQNLAILFKTENADRE